MSDIDNTKAPADRSVRRIEGTEAVAESRTARSGVRQTVAETKAEFGASRRN